MKKWWKSGLFSVLFNLYSMRTGCTIAPFVNRGIFMAELLSLSVAIFAGLLMTRLLGRLHLPDVTAYLIAAF